LKRWLNEVIASFDFSTGDIQIIFCTDAYLLDVNRKYLSHDYFTDIITFDDSSEGKLNGDLLISIDRVKENAIEFGVSFDEELNRVIVHGILHLIGFKDKSNKDRQKMREAENKALIMLNSLIVR
jgi:rRNA maturation RNase YbeY